MSAAKASQRRGVLTQAEVKRIIDAKRDGASIPEIAARFGVSDRRVRGTLSRAGLTRPVRISDQSLANALALGIGVAAIAKQLNLDVRTLQHRVRMLRKVAASKAVAAQGCRC